MTRLNLSLQEKLTTVFKLADKVAAFKAKLELWGRRVNRGIFDIFHTLSVILEETEPDPSFSQLVHDHLSLLLKEFERYFPTTKDPRMAKEWIRDPFVNKAGELSLSVLEENQLLDIANDGGLKSMFQTTAVPVFWIKIKAEYPEIAQKALKTLLPFPTSYLCEAGLSAVTATKTKLQIDWTYGTHFVYHCLPLPQDGTGSLQRNKLRALTNCHYYYFIHLFILLYMK